MMRMNGQGREANTTENHNKLATYSAAYAYIDALYI